MFEYNAEYGAYEGENILLGETQFDFVDICFEIQMSISKRE